jgi:hypothetical protein
MYGLFNDAFNSLDYETSDCRLINETPTHGGEFEYLHCSSVSHRRQQKGNPVPGGITGPPCSWGIYK